MLHKNWPLLAARFLEMAKMLERRMWHFETPLRQFPKLSHEILEKIEEKRLSISRIRDMDHKEIGKGVWRRCSQIETPLSEMFGFSSLVLSLKVCLGEIPSSSRWREL